MNETEHIKNLGYIGYRYEDHKYYLIDFSANDVLDVMDEVAIVFNGNVLLKHGSFERIKPYFDAIFNKYRMVNLHQNLGLICGKFSIDDLDKILSISDYIGTFVKRLNNE